jgi:hypothetical protein
MAGSHGMLALGYLKNNRLQEAEEASKRSLAIYEAIYAREEKKAMK